MTSEIVLGTMPVGALNWRVFNERRDRLRPLLDRVRCVGCNGKAPRFDGEREASPS